MGPEATLHIQVCEYLRQCTDLPFIHVANERACSVQQGLLLKRMGVVAGVSDLFLPRSNDKFHGLWIEFKSGKNKPTRSQLEFMNRMISEDYAAHVCYSADEAILVIKSFYGINH